MPIVRLLESMNLHSVYHALHSERHGHESTPTLYWRDRKRDGPTYHIDYVFAPKTWLPSISEFQIGSFDQWIGSGLSDHVPIIIEF